MKDMSHPLSAYIEHISANPTATFVILSDQGQISWASKQFAEKLDYQQTDLSGLYFKDFVEKSHKADFESFISSVEVKKEGISAIDHQGKVLITQLHKAQIEEEGILLGINWIDDPEFMALKSWHSLNEHLDAYVTIIDKDRNIQHANRFDFGLTRDTLIGRSYFDFQAEHNVPVLKDLLDQVFEGIVQVHESKVELPDGSTEWFSTKLCPLFIGETVERAICISTRITETKEAQSNLYKQEAQFRSIVENANDIIHRSSLDGSFTYLNPVFIKAFGYDLEKYPNLSFKDLVHPDHVDELNAFYNTQFIERVESTYFEFPTVTKEGKTIWIGQNTHLLKNGDWVEGFEGVARDITRRKEIEDKLKRSESRNRALITAIPDILLRISAEGIILDYRVGVEESPFDLPSVIGRQLTDLNLPENILAKIKTEIDSNMDESTINVVEEDFVLKSTNKKYEARIVRGLAQEVICIIRDVTERSIIEQHLIEARKTAEANSKSKEQYLSVMSHEIRTPLNAIVGLTELLLNENPPTELLEYVKGIQYSSDNLLKIVNDILDFSKIESNNIVIEKKPFDLNDVIVRVIQNIKANFPKKTLQLDYHFDAQLPDIFIGDPVRFSQILSNLLHNAYKFTHKGKVKVSVESITQSAQHANLKFVVEDTGIGIAPEKLPVIFESFKQASNETSGQFGGSGLGLAITKELIERQGGTIAVSSKLGSGSTFEFTLPFDVSSKDHLRPEIERHNPFENLDKSSINILIAEDNEMNQLVMSKYLSKWGLKYTIVNDGQEALDTLNESFSLVLLDLEMPVLDGYKTASVIRKLEGKGYNSIPIISVSASVHEEIKRKALNSGMNDFITKPIDSQELMDKIIENHFSQDQLDQVTKKSASNSSKNINDEFSFVDLDYLYDSSLNDSTYVKKMISMFVKNTPTYIKDFHDTYERGELVELRRLAHKYKASVNIMGISQVKTFISKLEDNINRDRNLEEIPKLLSGIEFYSLAACSELETYLNSDSILRK